MPHRTDAELLAMADRLSAAFFLSTRGQPGSRIRDDGDVIHGMTGIPLAIFNGATCARFTPDDAAERIEAVLRPFRDEHVKMSWFVGSTSTPPDLVDRLIAHGLTIEEVAPVLARSLADWPDPAAPAPVAPDGVTIERVRDATGFRAATEVMFAVFGLPLDVIDPFVDRYARYSIGPDPIQDVVLARRDGEPAATALGFVVDGVVGIFNVATLPEHERNGLGTAVTRAAIDGGVARGATAAILESSPAGRPVYERLGFHDVGTVAVLLGAFGERAADAPG